jgi:hypothetical protein
MAISRHDRNQPPGAPGFAQGHRDPLVQQFHGPLAKSSSRLSNRARRRNGPGVRPAAEELEPVDQLSNKFLVAIAEYRHGHHKVDDDMGR